MLSKVTVALGLLAWTSTYTLLHLTPPNLGILNLYFVTLRNVAECTVAGLDTDLGTCLPLTLPVGSST